MRIVKWSALILFCLAAVTWMAAQTKAPKPAWSAEGVSMQPQISKGGEVSPQAPVWGDERTSPPGGTYVVGQPTCDHIGEQIISGLEAIRMLFPMSQRDGSTLPMQPAQVTVWNEKGWQAFRVKCEAEKKSIGPRTATAAIKKKPQADSQYITFDNGVAQIKTFVEDGNWFLGKQKPKNGQCPVCGDMAEAWKVTEGEKNLCSNITDGHYTSCMPGPRTVRCKRCNAAFWQDAEAVKK